MSGSVTPYPSWVESSEITYTDSFSGLRFSKHYCEFLNFEAWISFGWLSHSLLTFGKYERPVFAALRRYLKRGHAFVDVGANVGLMSMVAHRITGGPILALEPEDRMRFILSKNFGLAGIPDDAICPVAAGGASGVGEIHLTSPPGMTSLVGKFSPNQPIQRIDIEPLDKILHWVPDAIKIDTEGYELEVIAGSEETFAKMRSGSFVISEPHPTQGTPSDLIAEELRRHGFEVHELNEFGDLIPLRQAHAQIIGFKK